MDPQCLNGITGYPHWLGDRGAGQGNLGNLGHSIPMNRSRRSTGERGQIAVATPQLGFQPAVVTTSGESLTRSPLPCEADSVVTYFTTRAGLPATTENGGTSRVTTA
jgi:hypothetical protein